MKVYITGIESASGSVGGIGLARAIRHAYPHAQLVGVSYAQLGTRIQWPDFDEQWDAGHWRALDFADHQREIEERLAAGAWWISGLPHETQWLAQVFPDHERVLVPPLSALEHSQLPTMPLARELGLSVPASILATASDWDLNTFGRRHGWRVWLRTPDGSSKLIRNWQAFHQARLAFGENGFSDALFLQEHIEGTPEALAFAAYRGELLGCTLCMVEDTANPGEWRASRIEETPAPLVDSLAQTLKALRWTGGGALSLMRDSAERRWALEWRAGFPSWIFGAALAGRNLPAQLLERATGEVAIPQHEVAQEFVRVEIEVPLLRSGDTQPHAPRPVTEGDAAQWRMSATPITSPGAVSAAAPQIPDDIVADVASATCDLKETPAWLFLPGAARGAFLQAADLMRRYSSPQLRVQVAYSVKTNPERRLLELAHASGLLAETISQAEAQKAMACGFPAGRIILNGPAKQWPASHSHAGAVACGIL